MEPFVYWETEVVVCPTKKVAHKNFVVRQFIFEIEFDSSILYTQRVPS